MADVRSDVEATGPVRPADEDVRAAIGVTTALIGLARLVAGALTVPALLTAPFGAGTAVAFGIPLLSAAVLVRGADRLTGTARRRVGLLAADVAAGGTVLAMAGFGIPCAYQSLGTAALAAALYGMPGVAGGAAVGMVAAVLSIADPAFGLGGPLPLDIVVSIPTAYALVALVAALIRHLHLDQISLRRSLRDATWSAALTQERNRLARDLHDSLATTLSGIALCARAVRADPGQADELAAEIAAAADAATEQARELVAGLRNTAGPELAGAVRQAAAEWSRGTGAPVRLSIHPVPEPTAAVRAQLVSVLGEALTNVRRHARAERVEVELFAADGLLTLAVRDDGRGFVVPAVPVDTGRYGLLGMTERMRELGGRLAVRSAPGLGTTVVAEVPHPTVSRPRTAHLIATS